jgi:hypothetical protein
MNKKYRATTAEEKRGQRSFIFFWFSGGLAILLFLPAFLIGSTIAKTGDYLDPANLILLSVPAFTVLCVIVCAAHCRRAARYLAYLTQRELIAD